MSLDRLKAVAAATALLAALGACDADASRAQDGSHSQAGPSDTTQGSTVDEGSTVDGGIASGPEHDETSASRLELAQQLTALSAPVDFSEQIVDAVTASTVMTLQLNHGGLSEEHEAEAELLAREMARDAEHRILEAMSAGYANLFTEAELEELVAFHASETGAKFRAVAQEVSQTTNQRMMSIVSEFSAIIASRLDLQHVRPEGEERSSSNDGIEPQNQNPEQ